jgi:hypothetical protein
MCSANHSSRRGRRRRAGVAAALPAVPFAIAACGDDKAEATARLREPRDDGTVAAGASDVVEQVFGTAGADATAEAAPWINEPCGVDIDG